MKTRPGVLVLIAVGGVPLAAARPTAEPDEGRREHSAGETRHAVKESDPVEALSPELQQLLVKEMRLIDSGMGELLSAISTGDWKTVESVAGKIQKSFILKQQLTERQVHEPHEKLPGEFVRMDVRFHETAGKLAAITDHRDAELATFYYSRLVDRCVSCHAKFAPLRFPGLAGKNAGEHQH